MSARREELESDIDTCRCEIADKRQEIANFEPDEDVAVDAYEEMLDECYEPFRMGQMQYRPSYVLKEVDPIAYHCGLTDYVDSTELRDWAEYRELEDELEVLENELEELEEELASLEDEAEEGEED